MQNIFIFMRRSYYLCSLVFLLRHLARLLLRKCYTFAQNEYLGVWFYVSSVPDCEYISVKEPSTFCSTRVHILQVSKQERSFILPSLCFGSYSGMLICLAQLGSRSSGSLTTVLGSTPHIVLYRQALGDSHGQFSIQV